MAFDYKQLLQYLPKHALDTKYFNDSDKYVGSMSSGTSGSSSLWNPHIFTGYLPNSDTILSQNNSVQSTINSLDGGIHPEGSLMTKAAPYLQVAQGAIDLFKDGYNNMRIPDYLKKDYGQYRSVESLAANAGNTEYMNLEKNNVGMGTLSGIGKGAMAGMGFGPIGAVVGGAIGGISNLLTGVFGNTRKKREEERRYNDAFNKIEGQSAYIKGMDMYGKMWNDYKCGGKMKKKKYGLGGYMHPFWDGGELTNGGFFSNNVDIVEAGGSHEENKYGGVPVSMDENGIPNTVEEGEVIWNNYVFSNRLTASPEALEAGNLNKSYKLKSFADIAKDLQKESEERPFDRISSLGKEDGLTKLMIAQEMEKLKQQGEEEINRMGLNEFASGGRMRGIPGIHYSSKPNTYPYLKDMVNTANSVENSFENNFLNLIHGYETSGSNAWDTKYNKENVAFGRFQHTRTFLYDLGYLKSKTGEINDIDNWKDKTIGEKYINGDVKIQADISIEGALKKEKSLIKGLGQKKYDELKKQYGRENILAAAWHGGEQTVMDIANGKDYNNRSAKNISKFTFSDTIARLEGKAIKGGSTSYSESGQATDGNNDDTNNFVLSDGTVAHRDAYGNLINYNSPNSKDPGKILQLPLTGISNIQSDPQNTDKVNQSGTIDIKGNPITPQSIEDVARNALKKGKTDWMIHAPVIGNGAAYLESLMETPEILQYDRVKPVPITERLRYEPINDEYVADRLRNQYEATRRGIVETTGGNRGLAQYGLMQNDRNMSDALYDAYVKGQEVNWNRKNQVMDFNRQTSQYNSQMDMNAQQINTQIDMQEQNINAANRAALRSYQSAARSQFLENLSGLGKQLRWESLAPVLSGGYDAYGNYLYGNNKKEKRK